MGGKIETEPWKYQQKPIFMKRAAFIDIQTACIYTTKHGYISCEMSKYLLTPWCKVLLEKLTGLQLVKKFPAFHGTRRFITTLTSICHLSLSWVSPIQSIYPHPTSWRSILILSTHLCLGLPSGLLPSGFPTKTLYTPSPHWRILMNLLYFTRALRDAFSKIRFCQPIKCVFEICLPSGLVCLPCCLCGCDIIYLLSSITVHHATFLHHHSVQWLRYGMHYRRI